MTEEQKLADIEELTDWKSIVGGLMVFPFLPILHVCLSYFVGWMLVHWFPVVGQWVISGAAALSLEIVVRDLPVIAAFLAFVGSLFSRGIGK